MVVIVKRIVLDTMFTQLVAGSIKHHANATTDRSLMTQRYDETENVKKKEVALLLSRSLSEAAENF